MALLHYSSSISDDESSRGEVVCSGLQYLYDESIKSIYLRLSVLSKGNYNSGGRTVGMVIGRKNFPRLHM